VSNGQQIGPGYPYGQSLILRLRGAQVMTDSEATLLEFHDEHYRDAHEDYTRWLCHHPSGFVLNLKTSTWAVLHESDCMHIADYSDPDISLTDKPKVCAPASAPLKAWAAERGMKWTRCGTCFG
jgi:hypothetical protein